VLAVDDNATNRKVLALQAASALRRATRAREALR
jgi:hypothetical protein